MSDSATNAMPDTLYGNQTIFKHSLRIHDKLWMTFYAIASDSRIPVYLNGS